MKNILTFILFLLAIPFNAVFANNENTDFMRSMGKMYTVVAVITATFIGIAVFLAILDRKISNIEKELKRK
jgi:CcmD family protein